jgi:hypothetical protein
VAYPDENVGAGGQAAYQVITLPDDPGGVMTWYAA